MSYDLRLIDRPFACTTRKSKHCDRAADANCTMTTTTRVLEAKDKRTWNVGSPSTIPRPEGDHLTESYANVPSHFAVTHACMARMIIRADVYLAQ